MQSNSIILISVTTLCAFFQINATTHFIVSKEGGVIQPQVGGYFKHQKQILLQCLNILLQMIRDKIKDLNLLIFSREINYLIIFIGRFSLLFTTTR